MSDQSFLSYAQNGEDVVLWRALHDVVDGCYIEVGANDPTDFSVSRAFYDRGWSGLCIEPLPVFVDAFRAARPRDIVVQAAVLDTDAETVVLHAVDGTGLSTTIDAVGAAHAGSGWEVHDVEVPTRRLEGLWQEHVQGDVHFLLVDTEGAESAVLASVDLTKRRPWVLVVEATAPMSDEPTHQAWEPQVLAAGYELCLFDGLSRFYVAAEHAERLRPKLSYPVCVLDRYVPRHVYEVEQQLASAVAERDGLVAQVVRWRGLVLQRWTEAAEAAVSEPGAGGHPGQEAARLRAELAALHRTVSWRVTKPLRSLRTAQLSRSPRR